MSIELRNQISLLLEECLVKDGFSFLETAEVLIDYLDIDVRDFEEDE